MTKIAKPAVTSVPIHPLLAERWSSRAFNDAPVGREVLLSLFEAARWSPSCFNEQSWRFIVATRDEPDAHALMNSCFSTSNQRWSTRAWVLMFSFAVDSFGADGSVNRMAQYDVGQAVASMTIQATDHGLNVRQAAGIDAQRVREVYAVPDGVTVMTGIAVGYPGDPAELVAPLPEREKQPRVRNPLTGLVFSGRFGVPRFADDAS